VVLPKTLVSWQTPSFTPRGSSLARWAAFPFGYPTAQGADLLTFKNWLYIYNLTTTNFIGNPKIYEKTIFTGNGNSTHIPQPIK